MIPTDLTPNGRRYVRTPGDRRARRADRKQRARGAWPCPGCGVKLGSAAGLAFHLIAEGPGIGQSACSAAQRERYGPSVRGGAGRALEAFEEVSA